MQRIDGVLRRLGLAEHVAGADAQDQVGRPARRPDRGLLDERDPAGEPAGGGVAPAPGEVGGAEVDAGADRPGDRLEDAEQQLAPAAAEVEHRGRTRPGEPGDETRGSGLGQRAVEGEAGITRRKIVGSHRQRPYRPCRRVEVLQPVSVVRVWCSLVRRDFSLQP